MMIRLNDKSELPDLDDEIARLYHESVNATIEVIIRDAINHGHHPADIAAALLAALDGQIACILDQFSSQNVFPNVH